MSDDDFVSAAVDAWRLSGTDAEKGWTLGNVCINPAVPPARCRIRLLGRNLADPPPRQEGCFAFVDRSPANAADLIRRLLTVIGAEAP